MAGLTDSAGLLFSIKTENAQSIAGIEAEKAAITTLRDHAIKADLEVSASNKAAYGSMQKGFHEAASELSNLTAIFTGNRLSGATSQITSFSGAVSAIPGPAGAAVGAIAGIAVAAAAAGIALFELTEKTAKYGNSIYETSVKTGLSATTISALKIAADQSGTSIENVSNGLRKFTVLMGEAAGGSDKAQAKLKLLHVTSTDLDTGLEQLLKRIAELPAGIQQNTAAAEAFGKRFGAQLIPLIEHFHGDLPGLIEELTKMGLVMSDKDAKQAHEFEVQMKQLGQQMSAVERTIGTELMPTFAKMAGDISSWLSRNKGEIKSWADTVVGVIYSASLAWEFYATRLKEVGTLLATLNPLSNQTWDTAIKQIGELEKRIDAINQNLAWGPPKGAALPHMIEGYDPLHPGAKKKTSYTDEAETAREEAEAKKEAEKAAQERQKAYEKELSNQKEHIKLLLTGIHSEIEDSQSGLDELFTKASIAADKYRQISLNNIEIYVAKSKKLLLDEFKLDAAGETPSGIANLRLAKEQANQAIDNDAIKRREDLEKVIIAFDKKTTDEAKKTEKERVAGLRESYEEQIADHASLVEKLIAQTYEYAEKNNISERNTARLVEQIHASQLRFKKEKLQEYLDALNAGSPEYVKATLELKRLDNEIETNRANNAKNQTERQKRALKEEQDLHDERRKHWSEYVRGIEAEIEKYEQLNEEERKHQQQLKEQKIVGSGSTLDAFGALHQGVLDNLSGTKATAAIEGINLMKDAFTGLGQAVGQVVSSFVLYGTAGQSVRQVTAQILASIAQQAAVQAIYELAQGFAVLALAFFGIPNAGPSAAAHFQAAALYGVVAGVAAVAGRAVAGNAFKQQSATATGGAGSSASGANPLTDANNPQNRFTEAFNGFSKQISKIQDRANAVLGGVEEQLNRFNETFGLATPTDVVMAGAGGAGNAIFDAHTSALGTGSRAETFRRTLG